MFFLGRADQEKAPHLAIEVARRGGRRLVMCATTKNERERTYWAEQVEPILGDGDGPAFDRVHELDLAAMRARVEQRFSADAMVAGYEGVYRQVLAPEDGAGAAPRP